MTYIGASHATCLRYRRFKGSCFITLFGSAVYHKINLQATVATSSTEADFIATVYGTKDEKYIPSILEELGLSRKVTAKLLCDNTASIIIENSKKPTYRDR